MANDIVQIVQPNIEDLDCRGIRVAPWDGALISTLDLPVEFKLSHNDCAKRSRKQDPVGIDGSKRFGNEWGERTIEVSATLKRDSKLTLQQLQGQLNAFLGKQNLALKWNNYYIFLSRLLNEQWRYVEGWGNEVAEVRISWACEDPFWYDGSRQQTSESSLNSVTYKDFVMTSPEALFPFVDFAVPYDTFYPGDTIAFASLPDIGFTPESQYVIRVAHELPSSCHLAVNHEDGSVLAWNAFGYREYFNSWLSGEVFKFSPSVQRTAFTFTRTAGTTACEAIVYTRDRFI